LQVSQKTLPGVGNQLNNSQRREVESRLKRSKALIQSMTKKEREDPELLISDKASSSRIMCITRR
jgi:signal recognition particle GTPase